MTSIGGTHRRPGYIVLAGEGIKPQYRGGPRAVPELTGSVTRMELPQPIPALAPAVAGCAPHRRRNHGGNHSGP